MPGNIGQLIVNLLLNLRDQVFSDTPTTQRYLEFANTFFDKSEQKNAKCNSEPYSNYTGAEN